jgi:hypothetical protein
MDLERCVRGGAHDGRAGSRGVLLRKGVTIAQAFCFANLTRICPAVPGFARMQPMIEICMMTR